MVKTGLDTNILSSLWSREPIADRLHLELEAAKQQGPLLISPVVYAELVAHPRVTEIFVRDFLTDNEISIDFELGEAVWVDGGRRYALYAARRRKSAGAEPKRFLADFLVGSHALHHADRLMTTDVSRYRTDFPELTIYPLR